MSQKGLANVIIVLLIIIIASAVGYFILTRKPISETTNWQTYRNGKFGFEIKYPTNWSNQQCDFTSVGFAPDSIKLPTCGTEGFHPLNLIIYSYATPQEAEDSLNRVSEIIGSSREGLTKTEIKLDNEVGLKISGIEKSTAEPSEELVSPTIGTKSTVILFLHGTDFYQIYYYGEFYKISSEEVFNQIVSTFKFIR